jgi:hypothetical protein
MTIPKDLQPYLDARHTLTVEEKKIVDNTFKYLYREGIANLGVNLPDDDRAEELEATLIKFVLYGRIQKFFK